VSAYDDEAWRVARDGDEARMQREGVAYLVAEFEGVRFIAPMGSVPPPGLKVETVYPSEDLLSRMRDLGRAGR